MKSKIKILAACVLAMGLATSAFADETQDVVVGPGSGPVKGTKFGNCVVTKWMSKDDVCGTPRPPTKEVVVTPPAPAPALATWAQ